MPIVDTEVLFATSPRDPRHQHTLRVFKEVGSLKAPDTAILEFQTVLRARNIATSEVKVALLALHEVLWRNHVEEAKTMNTNLLALQCEIEERYRLSYFDSLIAASALVTDRQVVSDDEAFDRVPELKRIPLSRTR